MPNARSVTAAELVGAVGVFREVLEHGAPEPAMVATPAA